jgi:hypothetical protein
MSERLLPEACQQALNAIEADPLALPEEALAHLRACPACREARVLWLAQEEAPAALTPAGYFDHLPQRVLRKLPARRASGAHPHAILWLAAAGLALALGMGGYLAGRVQRTPVVEATLEKPPTDLSEFVPDTPFDEGEDALTQLADLSPRDANLVLQRLESSPRP